MMILRIFIVLVAIFYSESYLHATDFAPNRVNHFALADVQITDTTFMHARDLNIHTLLHYDVDRLLQPFLREAGIETNAVPFENWSGLSGHVGGHYLSALALHYAATGNQECYDRMLYMVQELEKCALASTNGYIGGVPNSHDCWTPIKEGDVSVVWKYWVPWYNVHKIFAGLRDAWAYGKVEKAKTLFLNLCDWCIEEISNIDDTKMEQMLDQEFGGMNEVLADAYDITGEVKYLDAAIRFSHHWLLDSMVSGIDNLDNKHANTQVPKVVGYERVAEMCKKANRIEEADKFQKAADFFWHTVVDTRSLAIGGNSRREHFASAGDCMSYVTDREGPETCNTYNMLRLTEGLHYLNPKAEYADFYERAMYNHILSTQHPEHGGYVYFTSARPSHYRVYSQPNQAMWCCVGTGMENHGKYNHFTYTHINDTLWVNLFTSSILNWREKGITVVQKSDFPNSGEVTLTIKCNKPVEATILVRHPGWCDDGKMKAMVGNHDYALGSKASSYVPINRKWRDGDKITLNMPMEVTIEQLPNVKEYIAIMRGPIVMGAKTTNDDLSGLIADDGRWSHIAHGGLLSVFDTPLIIGERSDVLSKLNKMKPVEGKPMHYKVENLFSNGWDDLELQPFYSIHDCRYMMYWLSMTPEEYASYEMRRKEEELKLMALDKRTIDAVTPGEQQPEADHLMKSFATSTGISESAPWRSASKEGYFEYSLSTSSSTKLSLLVKYWGSESTNRQVGIYIDDHLLAVENMAEKWNDQEFHQVEYSLPTEIIEGKDEIKVRFAGINGCQTPAIFNLRLCTPEKE